VDASLPWPVSQGRRCAPPRGGRPVAGPWV